MSAPLPFLASPPDTSLLYQGHYDPWLVGLSVLIAVFAFHAALTVVDQLGQWQRPRTRLAWLAVGSLAIGGGTWAMHFIGMLAFSLPCRVSYAPGITLLSILPAILAGGIALRVISRPRLALPHLLLGSVLLGAGIGTMHYTGMAAMRLDGLLRYDPLLFAVSILVAVALSLLALWIRRGLGIIGRLPRRWAGAVSAGVMGGAVSGMHYTAMAAAYFLSDGRPDLPNSALNPTFLASAVSAVTGLLITLVLAATVVHRHLALARQLRQNEQKLRRILETTLEGFWMTDERGCVLQVNAALCAILMRERDEIVGHGIFEFVDAENRRIFHAQTALRARGEASSYEIALLRPDGSQVPCIFKANPILDETGAQTGAFALVTDISDSKRHEAYVRQVVTMFENTAEGVMLTDPNGVILSTNPAFTRITGYPEAEALGRTPSILKSGRHEPGFFYRMWQDIHDEGLWQGEIWNRRKNGEIYPEWLTISAVRDDQGRIQNYVGVFSDISRHKAAEEQIRTLAFFDPLTHLPNRRLLLDRLGHAIATSHRGGQHGAILFIDLDNFKTINDTRGHDVGDLLLTEVARRLSACVRDVDTVARQGGDEFVVLLEGLSENKSIAAAQTEVAAEKIRGAIAEPHAIQGHEFLSTPSIGASLFQGHLLGIDELLKRADVAMYQAKDAGRNTIRFFDPAMQAALDARAALEADLRRALPQGEFRLYFQAQVDASRQVIGAEALLRWEQPARGQVAPGAFIPLAEESGLILAIGRWVLDTACSQLLTWQTRPETRHLQLAVNVSARQFRQNDFVRQAHEALTRTGIDPARLKLELTESLVLDNVDDTIEKMQALNNLGVGFSMDDFGTGHSSLAYLRQLPLDQLKIDQSFVRDIASDPDDATIVRTIIAMARSLGLDVIAEGVESEAQFEFLTQNGCRAFQGYLFSQPVPLAAFEALLAPAAATA